MKRNAVIVTMVLFFVSPAFASHSLPRPIAHPRSVDTWDLYPWLKPTSFLLLRLLLLP